MAQPKPASRRDTPAAPAFTLTTAWVAVVLALLTLVFFRDVMLLGKTFVSPDATAPAGFVRLGEQLLWKNHIYPLWNPFVFLGMPSFGSGAYNPLMYPPDWPLALIARVVALPEMSWLVIYYFLGALFLYQLAREWGARPEGALLGALAFAFAPNLVAVGAHGHGSQLVDSAYLPLMVWLAARWLRRGNLSDLGWLALAGGFQFLRGHVQICFYTWMAVALYGAVEVAAALRRPSELVPRLVRALGLGAGAMLAFGIAGVYNLPLRDYAQYSIRGGTDGSGGVGMDYATQWSMAPFELPSIVWPNFAGFGGATYWGSMPFTDYPNAYMGIVAVLLALPSLLRRGRAQVYALVLGVFAILLSFGHHFPLYGFLYDHLPQFKKFRIPVMVILLFQLAVALGLAWGWSTVLEEGASRRGRKDGGGAGAAEKLLLAAGALLALCGLIVAAGGEGVRGAYTSFALAHKPAFSADLASAAYTAFSGDMGRVVLTGLAAVALAWLALRGRLSASVASVGVLLVLLFDLWPVSTQLMAPVIGDPVPHSLDAGNDDTVEFLQSVGPAGSFRVAELGVQGSNRLAGFGIGTVTGYHAAKLRSFQDLREPAGAEPLYSPTWLALLNVRFLVFPQALDPAQLPAWLKLSHTGAAAIYENMLALPRISVVSQYAVVADTGRAVVDSVGSMRRDPRTFTYLDRDPGTALGPVEGAIADFAEYTLHRVRVRVTTPGPGLLRLADQWYPDWKAFVDGKPVPILRADHVLRAVVVPAGSHMVDFRYESASVRRGLTLSLVSVGVALLLLGAGLVMGRRRRGAAGTTGAA
jgi:hypothetical protein